MAFVKPYEDDKTSTQAAPQTSGASAIAGSGGATQAPGGAGQQGTGFTNIQSYLGLNDTGKLADNLGAGADKVNNEYSGQVDGAIGTTKQAVDKGAYTGGNYDVNGDRSYKGPDATGASNVFKSTVNADPTKKNAANDYVGALSNDDGRGAILRDQNKDKGYSRGMGAFDSALLTGSGKADGLYNSKKAALGQIQSKADDFSNTGAGQYVGGAVAKSAAQAAPDAAKAGQMSIDKQRADSAQDTANYFKAHPEIGHEGPAQTVTLPTENHNLDYNGLKFKGLSGYLGS